jgi:glutamine amidotransferase
MLNVAILDYGVGNLHSLAKALARTGCSVRILSDPELARQTDALVLPGVGAFGAAASVLAPHRDQLRQRLLSGMPCLGICLGMQLLFAESEEAPGCGLGLIPGRVRRLRAARLPQMGWNRVEPSDDPLFAGLPSLDAYYANTFVSEPENERRVIGWSEYGEDRFAAGVRQDRVWGVQFHPEKSGASGLDLLGNFVALAR